MFEIVRFDKEENRIKDFIALKKKLYTRKNNTESVSDITRILTETHPLSHYFKLDKFLVYDDGKVCGRFCFTRYDDDPVCYIGFYECVNRADAAKFLQEKAKLTTKQASLQQTYDVAAANVEAFINGELER